MQLEENMGLIGVVHSKRHHQKSCKPPNSCNPDYIHNLTKSIAPISLDTIYSLLAVSYKQGNIQTTDLNAIKQINIEMVCVETVLICWFINKNIKWKLA